MLLNGLIASSGCGGRHAAENDPAPDPEAPTSLTINNDNLLDAIVYVYHDGQASRVGTVTCIVERQLHARSMALGPNPEHSFGCPSNRDRPSP
jgi:hypothetical protein